MKLEVETWKIYSKVMITTGHYKFDNGGIDSYSFRNN